MLTEAKEFILKPFEDKPKKPTIKLFGQEINPTAFAVAKSDFLLKNEDPRRITFGNSFSEDGICLIVASAICSRIRRLGWNGRR